MKGGLSRRSRRSGRGSQTDRRLMMEKEVKRKKKFFELSLSLFLSEKRSESE